MSQQRGDAASPSSSSPSAATAATSEAEHRVCAGHSTAFLKSLQFRMRERQRAREETAATAQHSMNVCRAGASATGEAVLRCTHAHVHHRTCDRCVVVNLDDLPRQSVCTCRDTACGRRQPDQPSTTPSQKKEATREHEDEEVHILDARTRASILRVATRTDVDITGGRYTTTRTRTASSNACAGPRVAVLVGEKPTHHGCSRRRSRGRGDHSKHCCEGARSSSSSSSSVLSSSTERRRSHSRHRHGAGASRHQSTCCGGHHCGHRHSRTRTSRKRDKTAATAATETRLPFRPYANQALFDVLLARTAPAPLHTRPLNAAEESDDESETQRGRRMPNIYIQCCPHSPIPTTAAATTNTTATATVADPSPSSEAAAPSPVTVPPPPSGVPAPPPPSGVPVPPPPSGVPVPPPPSGVPVPPPPSGVPVPPPPSGVPVPPPPSVPVPVPAPPSTGTTAAAHTNATESDKKESNAANPSLGRQVALEREKVLLDRANRYVENLEQEVQHRALHLDVTMQQLAEEEARNAHLRRDRDALLELSRQLERANSKLQHAQPPVSPTPADNNLSPFPPEVQAAYQAEAEKAQTQTDGNTGTRTEVSAPAPAAAVAASLLLPPLPPPLPQVTPSASISLSPLGHVDLSRAIATTPPPPPQAQTMWSMPQPISGASRGASAQPPPPLASAPQPPLQSPPAVSATVPSASEQAVMRHLYLAREEEARGRQVAEARQKQLHDALLLQQQHQQPQYGPPPPPVYPSTAATTTGVGRRLDDLEHYVDHLWSEAQQMASGHALSHQNSAPLGGSHVRSSQPPQRQQPQQPQNPYPLSSQMTSGQLQQQQRRDWELEQLRRDVAQEGEKMRADAARWNDFLSRYNQRAQLTGGAMTAVGTSSSGGVS